MEKTTSRIDSETELAIFIHKLMMSDIEIPSNVTLEIDSPILKSEIEKTTAQWIPEFEVKRIIYMGQNITFKSEIITDINLDENDIKKINDYVKNETFKSE